MRVVTSRTTDTPKAFSPRRQPVAGGARRHPPKIQRVGVDGRVLKCTLVALDAGAIAVAWTVAFFLAMHRTDIAVVAAVVVAIVVTSIVFARTQQLYMARACVVRAVEKARLLRLTVFATAVALVLTEWTGVSTSWQDFARGAALTLVLLLVCRASFRHWITVERFNGRFLRPVLVIGDNDEADDVVELLQHQPELGYRTLGYIGHPPEHASALVRAPHLGEVGDALGAVERSGATGVIVIATAHNATELNRLVHEMLRRGVHVQLSTGLHGVTHRRLRPTPISHEPLFYVEPGVPSRLTLAVKRAVDLTLGTIVGLLALPVIALAGIAIKCTDFGPLFYKQERIGRFGVPFTCFKLRTMRPGADQCLHEVSERNARLDSPLFKDPADPRRTKVGRILEATSIDELPQLWNVLRGDMSLVGPRPALAREVAQFDEQLLDRHNVRPGITGLWQVEGRDNPHFSPYRRLDLVYVENLSISLDLAILSITVQIVVVRALQRMASFQRRMVLRRAARAAEQS